MIRRFRLHLDGLGNGCWRPLDDHHIFGGSAGGHGLRHGGDHRGAAGQGFEHHVRRAFAAGGQHQGVNGTVVVDQILLRQRAEQPHAVVQPMLIDQGLQAMAPGALPGNQQGHRRQRAHGVEHQMMALQLDQIADGQYRLSLQAQPRTQL